MYLSVRITLISFLSIFIASCESLPAGVSPVQATWLYGQISLPSSVTDSGKSKSFSPSYSDKPWPISAEKFIKPGMKIPLAIHMHGCGGIGENDEAREYRDLMLSLGYAVFMPDSFQRPGRERLCGQGGMHERIDMRTNEVAYALKQIRKLNWVDQDRLVLMGFSEGGNATDNWYTRDFAGLIVLGSACTHSGGSPSAPAEVPVLAIVGESDDYRPGMSCTIKRKIKGSRSIVIPNADHWIATDSVTQNAIKQFLQQCCT